MDRRQFVLGSTAAMACLSSRQAYSSTSGPSSESGPILLQIDEDRTLGPISPSFMGLGYEISSVSSPNLLTATNHVYVQMVRTLGQSGVIRIGGNTSDYASFASNGRAVSSPKDSVVNSGNLEALGTFLDATGWQLIWGLNLGSRGEREAADEAQAVAAAVGDKLLAFEIGNEPDLFPHEKHRLASYSYDDYLKEYRRYKAAIRKVLPRAPFAGPDAALMKNWVTRFAADEGSDLKLLTHHYYRGGAKNPASTMTELLNPDPRLQTLIARMQHASAAAHVPWRICETNSFSGGGRPGVSNAFAAALWTLDYMLLLAWAGAGGVNMETGVNQLGFVSPYSPLGDDSHGNYTAMPDYYGMLAFAQTSRGEKVSLSYDAGDHNLTAYAVAPDRSHVIVTLINKDPSRSADVNIQCRRHPSRADAIRLTAASMKSTTGVTLAGSAVDANGKWQPTKAERVPIGGGLARAHMPSGSAALFTLVQG